MTKLKVKNVFAWRDSGLRPTLAVMTSKGLWIHKTAQQYTTTQFEKVFTKLSLPGASIDRKYWMQPHSKS